MIGDGVNDVPALKRSRLAVAMGSGSQVTKGVADIVLLADQFSMFPRAVAEGRRIARNIHRLGRLYLTKSVYAGFLILFAAITGFAFPFLPRQLTIAARSRSGSPRSCSRSRRARDRSTGAACCAPCRRSHFRQASRWEWARCCRCSLSTRSSGALSRRARTAATTTLIVLGPVVHPAAGARPRARAHHDPELHARHGRRPGRPVCAVPRRGAGARLLRPRDPLGGPVVPRPAVRCRRPPARGGRLARPLHPALEAPDAPASRSRATPPQTRPRRAARAAAATPAGR